jgi:DNA-binding NarL/FixJ family response regulator
MTPVRVLKKAPLNFLQELVDLSYKLNFVDRKFYKEHHRQNSLRRFRRDIEILDAYAITHKEKKLKEIAKIFNLSTTTIKVRVEQILHMWEYEYSRIEREKNET